MQLVDVCPYRTGLGNGCLCERSQHELRCATRRPRWSTERSDLYLDDAEFEERDEAFLDFLDEAPRSSTGSSASTALRGSKGRSRSPSTHSMVRGR